MLGYLSPLWPWILGVLAFSFGGIAFGTVPVFITKDIVNQALAHANMGVLSRLVMLLAAVLLASTMMNAVQTYLHGVLINRVIRDLRSDLFARVARQSPEEIAARGVEETTTRIVNDVGIASTGFSVLGWRPEAMTGVVGFLNMTLGFVANCWKLLVAVVAMLLLNWHFGLVFLIAFPPLSLLTYVVGRVLYSLSQQEYGNMGRLNATLVRSVGWTGSSWSRLFAQESKHREDFVRENAKISETSIASRIISGAHHNSYTFPVTLTSAFVWFYGGLQVMHGTMSLGALVAFGALIAKNTFTVSNFAGAFVFFPHLRGILDRIFAMWPPTEGQRLSFERRRTRVSPRPSLRHWLRDTGIRSSVPPALARSSLVRLVSFMLPYWPYFLLVVADAVIAVGGLAALVPLFQRQIIDSAIPHHNVGQLELAVVMISLFPLVHLFSAEVSATGHEFLAHRSLQRLRQWAYDQLGRLPSPGAGELGQAEAMSRVLNDVNGLYSAYGELSNLTWLFLPILPSVVLMTVLSWRLGVLVVMVTVPFVALLRYGGRLFYAINQRIFEAVEDLNTFTLKALEAGRLRAAQTDDRLGEVERSFAERNERLADLGLTSSVAHGWFGDVFGLHYTILTVLLWLVGGSMIIHGQLLLGTLVAVIAYAGKVEGFGGGFGVYLVVRTMQANADRVFSICERMGDPNAVAVTQGAGAPEGTVLSVDALQVDVATRCYEWSQPRRSVCAVEAGPEGAHLLEVLAGIRSPLAGQVRRGEEGWRPIPGVNGPTDAGSVAIIRRGCDSDPSGVEKFLEGDRLATAG